MSKPKPQKRDTYNKAPFRVFEKIYKRQLSEQEMSEIKYNFVKYIELLIELDRQRIEALQTTKSKGPPM